MQALDVFEDAICGWLFNYASKLVDLREADAGMAVMNLVIAYPEIIECYSTGTDSKGHSKEYFTNGMKRIFPELEEMSNKVLDNICDDLRNGLYHAGMLKGGVILVPNGPAVEYRPKKRVFRVNPFEFFQRVRQHFNNYISRLRAAGPKIPSTQTSPGSGISGTEC